MFVIFSNQHTKELLLDPWLNDDVTEKRVLISQEELEAGIEDFHNITGEEEAVKTRDAASYRKERIEKLNDLLKNIDSGQEDIFIELDAEFKSFLLDKRLTRLQKISDLWALLQDQKGLAFEFSADWFSSLKVIELTDQLIDKYEKEQEPAVRIKLLAIMEEATEMLNSSKLSYDQMMYVGSEIEKIQDLFLRESKEAGDKEVKKAALLGLSAIMPSEDAMEALPDELAEDSPEEDAPPLSNPQLLLEKFRVSLSSPDARLRFLPGILDKILLSGELLANEQHRRMLIMHLSLPGRDFTPDTRTRLTGFLEEIKPYFNDVEGSYRWLESAGAVQIDSFGDRRVRDNYYADKFANGTAFEQFGILNYYGTAHLRQLNQEKLLAITDKLQKEYLRYPKGSNEHNQASLAFSVLISGLEGENQAKVAEIVWGK